MKERALSRTDIERLFDELAERLQEKGTFAKLHVVGGACVALAYERERTTQDIDVRVDAGHAALEEAIREIAQAYGLPERWLNDQPRGFVPEGDDARSPTLYESQSLVVTGASGEYLLAMKLEASREKDEGDIRYLLDHLGMTDGDAALELHRTLFPNSRRTSGARALLAMLAQDDERLTPPTPIEVLRKQWQRATATDTFPRYDIEPTARGFRLTVQEEQDGTPEVLGESESVYTLVLQERTHRGWPHEATEIIRKSTQWRKAGERSGTHRKTAAGARDHPAQPQGTRPAADQGRDRGRDGNQERERGQAPRRPGEKGLGGREPTTTPWWRRYG